MDDRNFRLYIDMADAELCRRESEKKFEESVGTSGEDDAYAGTVYWKGVCKTYKSVRERLGLGPEFLSFLVHVLDSQIDYVLQDGNFEESH